MPGTQRTLARRRGGLGPLGRARRVDKHRALAVRAMQVADDQELIVGVAVVIAAPDELGAARALHRFFAVFLDRRNALAVGAPLVPGLRIFSPLPAAMRFRFALMLA